MPDDPTSRPRKRRRPPLRRKTVRWNPCEVEALLAGVREHGVGKWAAILRHSRVFNGVRTSVDLKDKWRNLTSPVRAAALASTCSTTTAVTNTNTAATPTPATTTATAAIDAVGVGAINNNPNNDAVVGTASMGATPISPQSASAHALAHGHTHSLQLGQPLSPADLSIPHNLCSSQAQTQVQAQAQAQVQAQAQAQAQVQAQAQAQAQAHVQLQRQRQAHQHRSVIQPKQEPQPVSPGPASPHLRSPGRQGTHAPLHAPSESSVTPDLLSTPATTDVRPAVGARRTGAIATAPIHTAIEGKRASKGPSSSAISRQDNADNGHNQSAAAFTPVLPLQSPLHAALSYTAAQSAALASFWRAVAADPSLARSLPLSSPYAMPGAMYAPLFEEDEDDEDEEDEDEMQEGCTRADANQAVGSSFHITAQRQHLTHAHVESGPAVMLSNHRDGLTHLPLSHPANATAVAAAAATTAAATKPNTNDAGAIGMGLPMARMTQSSAITPGGGAGTSTMPLALQGVAIGLGQQAFIPQHAGIIPHNVATAHMIRRYGENVVGGASLDDGGHNAYDDDDDDDDDDDVVVDVNQGAVSPVDTADLDYLGLGSVGSRHIVKQEDICVEGRGNDNDDDGDDDDDNVNDNNADNDAGGEGMRDSGDCNGVGNVDVDMDVEIGEGLTGIGAGFAPSAGDVVEGELGATLDEHG